MDDTIYAVSSGRLPSAIAIMRISGVAAGQALVALTETLPVPRVATLRTLCSRVDGVLDRALILWFPAPASATGEDVVELHLHGSIAIVAAVSRTLAALGLREAEPGEFTRRAVLNGRLDLNEAEGLADLLVAETEMQRRGAQRRTTGAFTRELEDWTARLLAIAADVERAIDYDDNDDGAPSIVVPLQNLKDDIETALRRPPTERMRDGIRVVIVGPVNSGKSSLFNALVRTEAAIVTPIEGTTRDLIERPVAIHGIPFVICDTAGTRDTHDEVERIGIQRGQAAAASADIVIDLDEQAECAADRIAVATKADLRRAADGRIPVSVRTGEGIDELVEQLCHRALILLPFDVEATLNQRQRDGLTTIHASLIRAATNRDLVLTASDLAAAREALDLLTGRAGLEDLLGTLFARFCLGK